MTSDANNFILNEFAVNKTGKNAGKVRLRPVGFYTSVTDLCKAVINKKLKSSTTRTMKAFLQEHNALCDEIRNLFRVGITGIGTMPCKECGNKQEKKAGTVR